MVGNLLKVRVVSKWMEATDICGLELAAVDGALPGFSAGSHIDLHLPNGDIRPYSLVGNLFDRERYILGVLREKASRGGSAYIHERVEPGDVIEISQPRNLFPLTPSATHSVLIAGGIGITPIIAMAHQLAADGSSFELHYFSRSHERAAFLGRLHETDFVDAVSLHFDTDHGDGAPPLNAAIPAPAPGTHLYVCGPMGFIDAVLGLAAASGYAAECLHAELFSARPKMHDGDTGFFVRLARSGRLVLVPPDRTIVEALADVGVSIKTSCAQGMCGVCATRVIEGIPDHRDLYFRPEEHDRNDIITPCCSRSKSGLLILDI